MIDLGEFNVSFDITISGYQSVKLTNAATGAGRIVARSITAPQVDHSKSGGEPGERVTSHKSGSQSLKLSPDRYAAFLAFRATVDGMRALLGSGPVAVSLPDRTGGGRTMQADETADDLAVMLAAAIESEQAEYWLAQVAAQAANVKPGKANKA